MSDERSQLAFHFIRICDELDPAIVVWENVDGVLTTKDNSFGCFLAALVGESAPLVPPSSIRHRWNNRQFSWTDAGVVVGPKRIVAWRVLDSQYFGLAQRRNRVFVAGCPANAGIDPSQILFESESVRRHPPSRQEKKEDIAGTIGTSTSRRGGDVDGAANGQIVAGTIGKRIARSGGDCDGQIVPCNHHSDPTKDTYVPVISNALTQQYGHGAEKHEQGVAQRLVATGDAIAHCVTRHQIKGGDPTTDNYAICETGVRRLTPIEVERLQGFPDNFTAIGVDEKGNEVQMADSPRYSMLGNAVSVNVAEWIGRRIVKVVANVGDQC